MFIRFEGDGHPDGRTDIWTVTHRTSAQSALVHSIGEGGGGKNVDHEKTSLAVVVAGANVANIATVDVGKVFQQRKYQY